jgi:hypothetical protein
MPEYGVSKKTHNSTKTKMSNDDEEAQSTNTYAHAAIKADHENDDRSLDGMEVEDWLIKQHHQQAKISDSSPQEALKRPKEEDVPAGSLRERLNGKKQGDEIKLQEEEKPLKVGDVGTVVDLPPPTTEIFTSETEEHSLRGGTAILNAEVTTLASYLDVFVAEMIPHQDNQVLVIEGVKAIGSRRRRVFLCLGGLLVVSLVAVAAARMITGIPTSSRSSALSGDAGENVVSNTTTLGSPTRMSGGGNLSLTLGDAVSSSPGGILSFAAANGAIDIFQKFISRTDKNFTYFSSSKMAKILGGISMSFIQKSLSREWSGHVVSDFAGRFLLLLSLVPKHFHLQYKHFRLHKTPLLSFLALNLPLLREWCHTRTCTTGWYYVLLQIIPY